MSMYGYDNTNPGGGRQSAPVDRTALKRSMTVKAYSLLVGGAVVLLVSVGLLAFAFEVESTSDLVQPKNIIAILGVLVGFFCIHRGLKVNKEKEKLEQ